MFVLTIIRAKDSEEAGILAAAQIAEQIRNKPDSVLGLATGSTPLGIYQELVRQHNCDQLDFSGVKTVNLDEYVGLDASHPQSYAYYMHQNLFSKVNIHPDNVHLPVGTAQDTEAQCADYDALIEGLATIDLQLVGIGHNGHIGFNEPADAFTKGTHCVNLAPSTIQANSRFFESADEVPTKAYTMGIKTIMNAKKVIMLVLGKEKAKILKAAMTGPITPRVPASVLQLHPDFTLVADADALSEF